MTILPSVRRARPPGRKLEDMSAQPPSVGSIGDDESHGGQNGDQQYVHVFSDGFFSVSGLSPDGSFREVGVGHALSDPADESFHVIGQLGRR